MDDDDGADITADDFAALDDTALLDWRAEVRAELERLSPGSAEYAALTARYDESTAEVNDRAREAWAQEIRSQQTQPHQTQPHETQSHKTQGASQ